MTSLRANQSVDKRSSASTAQVTEKRTSRASHPERNARALSTNDPDAQQQQEEADDEEPDELEQQRTGPNKRAKTNPKSNHRDSTSTGATSAGRVGGNDAGRGVPRDVDVREAGHGRQNNAVGLDYDGQGSSRVTAGGGYDGASPSRRGGDHGGAYGGERETGHGRGHGGDYGGEYGSRHGAERGGSYRGDHGYGGSYGGGYGGEYGGSYGGGYERHAAGDGNNWNGRAPYPAVPRYPPAAQQPRGHSSFTVIKEKAEQAHSLSGKLKIRVETLETQAAQYGKLEKRVTKIERATGFAHVDGSGPVTPRNLAEELKQRVKQLEEASGEACQTSAHARRETGETRRRIAVFEEGIEQKLIRAQAQSEQQHSALKTRLDEEMQALEAKLKKKFDEESKTKSAEQDLAIAAAKAEVAEALVKLADAESKLEEQETAIAALNTKLAKPQSKLDSAGQQNARPVKLLPLPSSTSTRNVQQRRQEEMDLHFLGLEPRRK